MIFSQWQPDGGYEYFESSKRIPIGEDMPAVKMPSPVGELGVPAQDVGYSLPADAKSVGFGDKPVGIMAPMARGKGMNSIGNVSGRLADQEKVVVVFLIAVLGTAWLFTRKERAA